MGTEHKTADMTAEREGAILEAALEKYGAARQRRQMIEEMAELTQALCKLERTEELLDSVKATAQLGEPERAEEYRNSVKATARAKYHVREEIADVQIMLNQMQLLYGDCTEREIRKLERLAWRLGMEDGDGE